MEGAEGAEGVEGRRNGGRRARGFAFIVVALMILAGGVFFDPLFGDALEHYRNLTEGVAGESEKQTRDAKDALEHYMLTRAPDRGWAKIRFGATYIEPRFLMLPCPDNVVEHTRPMDVDLDGTQDPTCGHMDDKEPLTRGSRFGRLPWNFTAISVAMGTTDETNIGDGLGYDFKDGTGNRLWYAVSRNFAPLKKSEDESRLLNFHNLATVKSHWLTVVNESGHPVSDRVAAVVLSPGRAKLGQERMSEPAVSREPLEKNDKRVAADLYFEKVTLNGGLTVRNYKNDGEFIGASEWTKEQTNDRLAFLSLDEMLSSDSHFMRQYKAQVGVRRAHNHPLVGSPLDRIQKGISAYYDFFGFYPTPATTLFYSNVETQNRHCAEWKIPAATVAMIPKDSALLTPATVTVTVITVTAGMSTVRLLSKSAFLAAKQIPITITLLPMFQSTVFLGDYPDSDWNDRPVTVTLARLARMTLSANTTLAISVSLTAGRTVKIPAGVSVFAPTLIMVTLPDNSPLTPNGVLFGWLPEHSRTIMAVGNNRSVLTAKGTIHAGFIGGGAILTTGASTVTINSGDKLIYEPGMRFQMQDNVDDGYRFPFIILQRADGGIVTLRPSYPLKETHEARGFAVFLTADVSRSSVPAPAVIYPWRKKEPGGNAKTRDTYHPYPPCFDSRDILEDAHRLFIEDQPMHYAVAANCHYGGENCGGPGGLTVTIAADVGFALPSPYAVSGDYAITLAARPVTTAFTIFMATIQITDGTISAIRANGKTMTAIFPSGSQWIKANERDDARARVGSRFTLAVSATLKFPAGIPFKTLDSASAIVEDADALLMYSPGPLRSVECAHGLAAGEKSELELRFPSRVELTVSDQRRSAALDLRQPCNWLDLDENADGDATFTIPPPRASRQHPDFNDYFLLFGGNVTVR